MGHSDYLRAKKDKVKIKFNKRVEKKLTLGLGGQENWSYRKKDKLVIPRKSSRRKIQKSNCKASNAKDSFLSSSNMITGLVHIHSSNSSPF